MLLVRDCLFVVAKYTYFAAGLYILEVVSLSATWDAGGSRQLCSGNLQPVPPWRQVRTRPYDSLVLMKYRDCVHEWRRLVQQQEISVEENIISADSVNTFYKFVNKRLTNRSSVISVTDMDGTELINDLDTANAFNNYFASVVAGSNNLTPSIPSYHIVSPLSSISLSECDVLAAINKLKGNLSAGPDGLPPLLFKQVKRAIIFHLTVVFRQLLSVGCVPVSGKMLL